MVEYRVKVGNEAKENLRSIYFWLKENEGFTVANKVRTGLLDSIDSLKKMPQIHGLVQEIQSSKFEYRRVLKWSYKIIFTINENQSEVLVVDVIHSKRNPKDLQEKFGASSK